MEMLRFYSSSFTRRVLGSCLIAFHIFRPSVATTLVATSPLIQWWGRTRANGDNTVKFNWEGVQFRVSVEGASTVSINLRMYEAKSKLKVIVDGMAVKEFVADGQIAHYVLANDLDPDLSHTISVYNNAEPLFYYSAEVPTLVSVSSDGSFTNPPTSPKRRIQFVGDSITAGFGAGGSAPCNASIITDDHFVTYGAKICEYFSAECSETIARSGRGMIVNCCDDGQTMPEYFLQSLCVDEGEKDWDFKSAAQPDAVVVNLGTNDFSRIGADITSEWVQKFEDTYVEFVYNVSKVYYSSNPVVFLGVGPMIDDKVFLESVGKIVDRATMGGVRAFYLDMLGPVRPPLDGCQGHPGIAGHEQMFQLAKPVIATAMGW